MKKILSILVVFTILLISSCKPTPVYDYIKIIKVLPECPRKYIYDMQLYHIIYLSDSSNSDSHIWLVSLKKGYKVGDTIKQFRYYDYKSYKSLTK